MKNITLVYSIPSSPGGRQSTRKVIIKINNFFKNFGSLKTCEFDCVSLATIFITTSNHLCLKYFDIQLYTFLLLYLHRTCDLSFQ